mgnify:CR=1 FL=1
MNSQPGAGDGLTRRERQIMEIIHAHGPVSARIVHEKMADPPTYATVRTLLRVLEQKAQIDHTQDGKTYIYRATQPREVEGPSTLRRVVQSFFSGSVEQAMSCLIDGEDEQLDQAERDRLEALIVKARQRNQNLKNDES